MSDKTDPQHVTVVTRNEKNVGVLVLELTFTALAFYYAAHPNCIDDLKQAVKLRWDRFVHKVSVWQTQASIQSLPEIDPDH